MRFKPFALSLAFGICCSASAFAQADNGWSQPQAQPQAQPQPQPQPQLQPGAPQLPPQLPPQESAGPEVPAPPPPVDQGAQAPAPVEPSTDEPSDPQLEAAKGAQVSVEGVPSSADGGPAPSLRAERWQRERFFLGAGVGYAWANTSIPEISTPDLNGAILTAHAGYVLSEHFTMSLEFTHFQATVVRDTSSEPFRVQERLHTLASAQGNDMPRARKDGGFVSQAVVGMSTLGPRIEFAPFGPDGLFVSGSAGAAILAGVHDGVGFGATARAGYRQRLANISLSVEGGFQSQTYADASLTMPFVSAVLRPYF